ncbi:MAG: pilus assembly protein TadG-related protein, partial [Planctomyces sp.]
MFVTGTNPVVTLRTAPAARRRDLRGRAGRRGNILLGFAILLFAIFALAALVIDLGVRSMTQRQMQTAVDAAAVEGLRFRDDP